MNGGDSTDYVSGGGEYDADKDMVLLDVEQGSSLSELIVEYGNPSKVSEFLEGYYLRGDFTRKMLESEEFDINLNLHLRYCEVKINYNVNGGELNSLSKEYVETIELPYTLLDPTKEGSTFSGWFTDAGLTPGNEITQITTSGEYNVYAKWI